MTLQHHRNFLNLIPNHESSDLRFVMFFPFHIVIVFCEILSQYAEQILSVGMATDLVYNRTQYQHH